MFLGIFMFYLTALHFTLLPRSSFASKTEKMQYMTFKLLVRIKSPTTENLVGGFTQVAVLA
jgi:hypothetical protein